MEYDSRRRVVARPHMSMSERAKIFIPFDALKGFREELERRERKVMASDAPELMEERLDTHGEHWEASAPLTRRGARF